MVQRIQLQLVALSLPCDGTIMRFIFQLAFLHLQGFSTSASPRNRACVTRPSPLVGGVWARDYATGLLKPSYRSKGLVPRLVGGFVACLTPYLSNAVV